MTQDESAAGSDPRLWWLSTRGEPEGPYTEDYVIACLKTGTIPATAHACPAGGDQWKLLSEWPQFGGQTQSNSSPPPQPPPVPSDSPLTNRQLPTFANWICIYAILVGPVLWVVDNLSCCMTGVIFHAESDLFGLGLLFTLFDAVFSLATTILLAVGGLRLRALRRSGPFLIKVGVWASLAWFAIGILLILGMLVMADESDYVESTTAGDLVGFFILCVGVLALAFEVIALVWLRRYGDRLPLNNP